MAGSRVPVPIGRGQFVLRFSLITLLSYALDSLPRTSAISKLPHWHEYSQFLYPFVVLLLAKSMLSAINGRHLDAVLPRWCSPVAFATWILATLLLPWNRTWPIGLALIGILLVAGGLIPGKPGHLKHAAVVAQGKTAGAVSGAVVPLGLFNGPVSFLRAMVTFACIGVPLIWVGEAVASPTGPVISHFGLGALYFVWVFKVLGRFADSGHTSNVYWLPFCIGANAVAFLPLSHHLINRYESLGLFLVVQLPLVLLPSRHKADEFIRNRLNEREKRSQRERAERLATWGKMDFKPPLLGPLAFVRNLLIIASLWTLVLFWENASSGPIIMWFARSCYLVLSLAWIMSMSARLTDARLNEGWYGSQYALVVCVVSLMPLAVHWVNAYQALAIFFLIQTPTALLPSKPPREESQSA